MSLVYFRLFILSLMCFLGDSGCSSKVCDLNVK